MPFRRHHRIGTNANLRIPNGGDITRREVMSLVDGVVLGQWPFVARHEECRIKRDNPNDANFLTTRLRGLVRTVPTVSPLLPLRRGQGVKGMGGSISVARIGYCRGLSADRPSSRPENEPSVSIILIFRVLLKMKIW